MTLLINKKKKRKKNARKRELREKKWANLVSDPRALNYKYIAHYTKEVYSEFYRSLLCTTEMVITNSNWIPEILT